MLSKLKSSYSKHKPKYITIALGTILGIGGYLTYRHFHSPKKSKKVKNILSESMEAELKLIIGNNDKEKYSIEKLTEILEKQLKCSYPYLLNIQKISLIISKEVQKYPLELR